MLPKLEHLPWEITTDPARLRAARLTLKKSQEMIARILGITHAAFSRWENGHAIPQPAHRDKLWELINQAERINTGTKDGCTEHSHGVEPTRGHLRGSHQALDCIDIEEVQMTDTTSKYIVYMLRGLPAGVFGEAYVVVASATISTGTYRAEYYILTQRPQESLHSAALKIAANDLPAELGIVDAAFVIGEGLRQAELDIFELLEKRSIELNRPDVALLPFDLQECQNTFVGCRMRGRFLQQLADIGTSTKCPSLSRYMILLQQVSVAE